MNGTSHLIAGTVVGGTSAYFLSLKLGIDGKALIVATSAAIGGFGGVLPDIDLPNSAIGSKVKPLSKALYKAFGHRTITHSLLFPALYSLIYVCFYSLGYLSMASIPLFVSFIGGQFIHMVQDTFTKGGVPWLYPLKKWKYSLCKMKTGSTFEGVVTAILLVVYVEAFSFMCLGKFYAPWLMF